eukprot:363646-Chlamydomonas_euryale.AAC.3
MAIRSADDAAALVARVEESEFKVRSAALPLYHQHSAALHHPPPLLPLHSQCRSPETARCCLLLVACAGPWLRFSLSLSAYALCPGHWAAGTRDTLLTVSLRAPGSVSPFYFLPTPSALVIGQQGHGTPGQRV